MSQKDFVYCWFSWTFSNASQIKEYKMYFDFTAVDELVIKPMIACLLACLPTCLTDWVTHRQTDRPTDRPTDRQINCLSFTASFCENGSPHLLICKPTGTGNRDLNQIPSRVIVETCGHQGSLTHLLCACHEEPAVKS